MNTTRHTDTDTDAPTVAVSEADLPHRDLSDSEEIHAALRGAEAHLEHLRDLADEYEDSWRSSRPAKRLDHDRPPHRRLREAVGDIETALRAGDESDRAQLVRGLKAGGDRSAGYTASRAAKRLQRDVTAAVDDLRDIIPKHRRPEPSRPAAGARRLRTSSTWHALRYLEVLAEGRDPRQLGASGWSQ